MLGVRVIGGMPVDCVSPVVGSPHYFAAGQHGAGAEAAGAGEQVDGLHAPPPCCSGLPSPQYGHQCVPNPGHSGSSVKPDHWSLGMSCLIMKAPDSCGT